jgi:hypothetical protein
MKKTLLTLMLLATGSAFGAARVVVGVGVGAPYGYYAPAPCPGPGYGWVDGSRYTAGPHRYWRDRHWAPPVHERDYRPAPRHDFRHGDRFRRR